MKQFVCVISFAFVAILTNAQTVKVKKESARIKDNNVEGYAVDLDAKNEEVNSALQKYFKSLGKVKQNDGIFSLTESNINYNGPKSPIYGTVKEKGSTSQAWVGIKKEEWTEGVDNVGKELEKMLYTFGVEFYRDKIQGQIDESNSALMAVEKQKQRLGTQNRDFNTKLEDNKREKIHLDESLQKNKLEYETLLKKIVKNIKDKDSVALAGEQIKKMIEIQKEKQRKVN